MPLPLHVLPCSPYDDQLKKSFIHQLSLHVHIHRELSPTVSPPIIVIFRPQGRPNDEFDGVVQPFFGKYKMCCNSNCRNIILFTAFATSQRYGRGFTPDCVSRFKYTDKLFISSGHLDTQVNKSTIERLGAILVKEYEFKQVTDDQSQVDHSTGSDGNRYHSTGRDVDRHVDRDHTPERDVDSHVDRHHSTGRDVDSHVDRDNAPGRDVDRHVDRDHTPGRDVDSHVDRDHSPGRDVESHVDRDHSPGRDVDSHVDRDHSPGRDVDRHVDRDHSPGRDVDRHVDRDNSVGRDADSHVDRDNSPGRCVYRYVYRDQSPGRDVESHVNTDNFRGRDVDRHIDRHNSPGRDADSHGDGDHSPGRYVDSHVNRVNSPGRDFKSHVDGNQSIGSDFNRHVDIHVDRDHSTGRDFNRHTDRDLSTGKDVDRHVDRYHSTGRDNPCVHCVTGCDQNNDDIDRLRTIKDEMKTKTTELQLRVETKLKLRAGILPRILDKVLLHLEQEREAAEIRERPPLLLGDDVTNKIEERLKLDKGSVNKTISSLLEVRQEGKYTLKRAGKWLMNSIFGKS